MLKRIDECDLKRENVDARLGLLDDGSENVIPFDHRSSVNFTVVTALKINLKSYRDPRGHP